MQPESSPPEQVGQRFSRPLHLGYVLTGADNSTLQHNLFNAAVILGIDASSVDNVNAQLTFRTIARQVLRFCPRLLLDCTQRQLIDEVKAVAEDLYESDAGIAVDVGATKSRPRHPTVLVGTEKHYDEVILVNSGGWVARISAGPGSPHAIPSMSVHENPIGAVAAASLASADVFFKLIGYSAPIRQHELSTLTGQTGPLGTLEVGPDVPDPCPEIDALLAGCGAVGNGWTAAVAPLPLSGNLIAVDRQAVATENIGPYVLAGLGDVGQDKVKLIARALEPAVSVRSFTEELNLFLPRITQWQNFPVPRIVVSGLDEAAPRHLLQRLWPQTLIDMAAGGGTGTTSQVHLHHAGKGGQCLLGVHTVPPGALSYAERVSQATGIHPHRIERDYNRPITEEDVAAAPDSHKAELERARREGQLICSRIRESSLRGDRADTGGFAPAAPFVAGLSGAIGASLTVQTLMDQPPSSGWHWQYSFISGQAHARITHCSPGCECHSTEAT